MRLGVGKLSKAIRMDNDNKQVDGEMKIATEPAVITIE